jgi:hypothetical protein
MSAPAPPPWPGTHGTRSASGHFYVGSSHLLQLLLVAYRHAGWYLLRALAEHLEELFEVEATAPDGQRNADVRFNLAWFVSPNLIYCWSILDRWKELIEANSRPRELQAYHSYFFREHEKSTQKTNSLTETWPAWWPDTTESMAVALGWRWGRWGQCKRLEASLCWSSTHRPLLVNSSILSWTMARPVFIQTWCTNT